MVNLIVINDSDEVSIGVRFRILNSLVISIFDLGISIKLFLSLLQNALSIMVIRSVCHFPKIRTNPIRLSNVSISTDTANQRPVLPTHFYPFYKTFSQSSVQVIPMSSFQLKANIKEYIKT